MDEEIKKRNDNYVRLSDGLSTIYPSITEIGFPETKVLTKRAFTTGVTSCCAVIIYNESNEYLFGHYNCKSINIEEDQFELTDYLDHYLEVQISLNAKKAIIIGGDTDLYNYLSNYLMRRSIAMVASYLDNYGQNGLEPSLCDKTVYFNPTDKTAIIYSPILKEGYLKLDHQHIVINDQFVNFIELRKYSVDSQLKNQLLERNEITETYINYPIVKPNQITLRNSSSFFQLNDENEIEQKQVKEPILPHKPRRNRSRSF